MGERTIPATLPWPPPRFPEACCAAGACARHFARGYRDDKPCGPLSREDLEKLIEDAHIVFGRPYTGWHSVETKLARGALAAVAELLPTRPEPAGGR